MKYGKLDELDETHKWKLGLVKAILYHIMSVAGLIMDSAFDARCYVWKNLKYLCTITNVHFGEWINTVQNHPSKIQIELMSYCNWVMLLT